MGLVKRTNISLVFFFHFLDEFFFWNKIIKIQLNGPSSWHSRIPHALSKRNENRCQHARTVGVAHTQPICGHCLVLAEFYFWFDVERRISIFKALVCGTWADVTHGQHQQWCDKEKGDAHISDSMWPRGQPQKQMHQTMLIFVFQHFWIFRKRIEWSWTGITAHLHMSKCYLYR